MGYPTLKEEQKLWQKGYKVVACIDEVGRGPLAGPVVACAATISNFKFLISSQLFKNSKLKIKNLNLRDSKKLSPKQREEFYKLFVNHPAIEWGIGRVYPQVIDRINIYQATKLAMQRAFMNLNHKLQKNHHITKSCYSKKRLYIDFLILDGNMKLEVPILQTSIVKGDEKVFSCAIASIIAKVKRDRAMKRYHKTYPEYGFDAHKGYGTPQHLAMLKKYGSCPIHRKSFAPCNI